MYLVKQSNAVYYSRMCYPQALINIGYPFDIKVSLLTKDRATAVLRNLHISAIIKQSLFDESPLINPNPLLFRQFKRDLDQRLDHTRRNVFKTCEYILFHPLTFNLMSNLLVSYHKSSRCGNPPIKH